MTLRLTRGAGSHEVVLPRNTSPAQAPRTRPVIEEVEPGAWYVDLDRLTRAQLDEAIDDLAAAAGVVFDLRGYPNDQGAWQVLAHLTDEEITCAQWHVPRPERPDRIGMAFHFSNWKVRPEAPRIRGKVVFLTDGRAISAAETLLGIVENYELGEIVGEGTAGTNGNINPLSLPGGYHVIWTGMKVLKHDGGRHHGVGILPTIPVARTVEGIRAGRDEYLARGLEVIRAAQPK